MISMTDGIAILIQYLSRHNSGVDGFCVISMISNRVFLDPLMTPNRLILILEH